MLCRGGESACRSGGGELTFRMATAETLPATPSIPAGPSVAAPARTEPPEFPGCNPVHLPRAEIERYEGRLEYWDATIETAWICEPTTSYHERPAGAFFLCGTGRWSRSRKLPPEIGVMW